MWNNEIEVSLNYIHLLGPQLYVQLWKTESVTANKGECHSLLLFDLIITHSGFYH